MAKIDDIRALFSIGANKEWLLHQFNVKNTFLHGEINKVYMKARLGFSRDFITE